MRPRLGQDRGGDVATTESDGSGVREGNELGGEGSRGSASSISTANDGKEGRPERGASRPAWWFSPLDQCKSHRIARTISDSSLSTGSVYRGGSPERRREVV
ncbi:hypothetical protein NL676_007108 [Syzygium grande]|nr:hypothetical protein NL676_007108 [Syzygium grande]